VKRWRGAWYSDEQKNRFATEDKEMKNFILALFLLILTESSLAGSICTTPELSAVIYFGNGINTTRNSATSSLDRLSKELGDDYNGHKLEYALAYNQTGGMALDLVQATIQSGIQFTSRFTLWLNGVGLASDWFTTWFQDYLMRKTVVVAEEVAEHANFYLNDILGGKKVIVVSHSQGNFYVNEAKDLLARQLPSGKMASFAIFGAAVPSDSIGGNSSPYLTNHRDFIQKVPGSLAVNWKLYRSDRKEAEDVGMIQAHLFNATYISNDFDIRPTLVSGIKTQIDAAARPAYSCETFNKTVLTMVTGTYITTCGIKPNRINRQVVISTTGITLANNISVDLTGIQTMLSLNQQPESSPYPINLGFFGAANSPVGVAAWDINRVFRNSKPPIECSVDDETPPTAIGKPFSITKTMMAPLQGLYRLLPKNSCTYDGNLTNDKPIEFSFDGSRIHLGERSWEIAAESEVVSTVIRDIKSNSGFAPLTEPGFFIDARQGPNNFSIDYTRNKEIRRFIAIEENKSGVVCNFDQRDQSL
jgi:hypothetical protein